MQFLSPRNDVAFKQATILFLNAILGAQGDQQIIDVQFQYIEQSGVDAGSILGILCSNEIGRKYSFEIRALDDVAFTDRMDRITYEYDQYLNALMAILDDKGRISFARNESEAKGRAMAEAIAVRLLRSGQWNMQKISEITGLSVEEIEKLKNDNNC